MAGLTWLHLSDWHQEGKDFNRAVVRDALMEDIKNRTEIGPNLEQIDFIVFSGDIAYRSNAEEYEAAIKEFFDPLLEAAEVGKDRLFVVPGNHDLDRTISEELSSDDIGKLLDKDIIAERLENKRKRQIWFSPFGEYANFIENYLSQHQTIANEAAYSYLQCVNADDIRVAILGVNTAWLSGRSKNQDGEINDYGFLAIGAPQIYDLLQNDDFRSADIRIVIMHHPFGWLVESDRNDVEKRLCRTCDFILCGHQHQQKISVIKSSSGDCVIIPAGASYNRIEYANAYNFVHVDCQLAKGTIYFQEWRHKGQRWIKDLTELKEGKYGFELPKRASKETSATTKSDGSQGGRNTPVFAPYTFTHDTWPVFQWRKGDLKWLHGQFASLLRDGYKSVKSQTVIVWGKIGIGKHRLLNEFAKDLLDKDEARVVIRRLDEMSAPDQMLAQLAVDLRNQYPEVQNKELDRTVAIIEQGRAFNNEFLPQNILIEHVLWNLIDEFAKHKPLVLVLERLHEGHPRLMEFFKITVRSPRPTPVLVIGTARSESTDQKTSSQIKQLESFAADNHVERLTLKGLEKPEINAIVDELCTPPNLGGEFYRKLYECTYGNPCYTIEIVKQFKQLDLLFQETRGGPWMFRQDPAKGWSSWTSENLTTIARNIRRALTTKEPQAGAILEKAVVIGPRFLLRLLQNIVEQDDDNDKKFDQAISVMKELGLIQKEQNYHCLSLQDDTYCFQPPVLQEALYEQDRGLHLTIARLLGKLYSDSKGQERLRFWRAYHYERSGAEEEFLDFLRESLHDVADKQQPFESIWLYERILNYPLQWREKLDFTLKLAALYSEVGRFEDAFNTYRSACEIGSDNHDQAVVIEATGKLGWLRVKQGKFEDAEKYFKKAVDLLRDNHSVPDHVSALVYRLYGGLFLERLVGRASRKIEHDAKRALHYTYEAWEYLKKNTLSDPNRKRDLTLVLNNIGRVLYEGQDYEEARQYFQDALDMSQGAIEAQDLKSYILNNLGSVAARLEQFDKAKRFFQDSLKITDKEENVFLRTKSLLNLAEICIEKDQYEESIPIADEGLWYANLLDHRTYKFDGCCLLGKAYLQLGNFDKARFFYEQAQTLTDDSHPAQMLRLIDMIVKKEENNEDNNE